MGREKPIANSPEARTQIQDGDARFADFPPTPKALGRCAEWGPPIVRIGVFFPVARVLTPPSTIKWASRISAILISAPRNYWAVRIRPAVDYFELLEARPNIDNI